MYQENNKNSDGSRMLAGGGGVFSPWKKPKRLHTLQHSDDKHVYDLYAVCYHHGKDVQSGHYTG